VFILFNNISAEKACTNYFKWFKKFNTGQYMFDVKPTVSSHQLNLVGEIAQQNILLNSFLKIEYNWPNKALIKAKQ